MVEPKEFKATEAWEFHGRNHTYSFGYGDLGVPSYLFELGTSFFQSCSYFENNILRKNHNALLYALKIARSPYITPAGPEVAEISQKEVDGKVTFTAVIDDTRYGNQSGTESTQNIKSAEIYINAPPWMEGAKPITMLAVDGSFSAKKESVTVSIDLRHLSPGRHVVFMRGQDIEGNWGPISAAFIDN